MRIARPQHWSSAEKQNSVTSSTKRCDKKARAECRARTKEHRTREMVHPESPSQIKMARLVSTFRIMQKQTVLEWRGQWRIAWVPRTSTLQPRWQKVLCFAWDSTRMRMFHLSKARWCLQAPLFGQQALRCEVL